MGEKQVENRGRQKNGAELGRKTQGERGKEWERGRKIEGLFRQKKRDRGRDRD